jgi:hypothetical protein
MGHLESNAGMSEKKIAILGTAGGWQDAPFNDDSWELWGLNTLYKQLSPAQLSRFSRWFELHGDTPITRLRRPDDHWASLEALKVPVYTFHELPTITRVVKFPIQTAIDQGKDYFACTMCYQVALALSEGVTELALYGISLTTAREALVERPCLEWWLGLAEGRGVRVTITKSAEHGLGTHQWRYAFDDQEERTDTYLYVYEYYIGVMKWLIE